MKITVIGTGYVGLVTGTCLAELGNDVFCLDTDQAKIDLLNGGGIPIFEPGLKELVERNRNSGRLTFSTDAAAAVAHGDIQFIAVGTPPSEDGSADLAHVLSVAKMIGRHITGFKVVVNKSTVPVGTAEQVHAAIANEIAERKPADIPRFSVVSNPEFLKEGDAVADFMRPDRIVVGADDTEDGRRAREMIARLYAPFVRNHDRILYMNVRSAEFTKYAANAMLATRISFMNELANLAGVVGVDIEQVRKGIGSDPRIGYSFLYAGIGYGGSCLPKDVSALNRTAAQNSRELRVLQAVEEVNNNQKRVLVDKVIARFGEDLTGRTFALWGLAFKPNTDDMRAAPSRVIISELVRRGARMQVHDPVAAREAKRCIEQDFADRPDLVAQITFPDDPLHALRNADALLIATEWKAYRSPDFDAIRRSLKMNLIFDGRNLYEPGTMRELGFEYFGIGR